MEDSIKNYCKSLGCKNIKKIALAHQVYIELVEVRLMYEVEFHYCKKMDLIYLSAKTDKKEDKKIYIPHSTSDKISMKMIDDLQNEISTSGNDRATIILSCMESDSTIVFYAFTRGLIDVQKPETFVRQKEREERKEFLENEIKRRKNYLILEAHQNGVVDE